MRHLPEDFALSGDLRTHLRPAASWRLQLRWIALGVCFWTAVGWAAALPRLAGSGNWQHIAAQSLADWWSWGLLTPLVTGIDNRLRFSSQQTARRILVHAALAPLVAIVYAYLSACIAAAMGVGEWSEVFSDSPVKAAFHEMFWSVLVYGLIIGAHRAHQLQQRYLSAELAMERLERNFSEARLNGLRMQLHPHFLFNALNTISSQVEQQPRLARQMIEHLGDLLRASLSSQSRSEIELGEELATLDHYLAIQKIRFGNALRVHTNICADVMRALVPSLLLQPLVENAIRHGLAPRSGGGCVSLIARSHGDKLQIRIVDDGVGLPAGWSAQGNEGLGLSLTRERVVGLHPGGTSRFAIHPHETGGTEVEVDLPLRVRGEGG